MAKKTNGRDPLVKKLMDTLHDPRVTEQVVYAPVGKPDYRYWRVDLKIRGTRKLKTFPFTEEGYQQAVEFIKKVAA